MKLFVWDYHGTLEKGNELASLEISNLALQKFGYAERFSTEDAIKLYGKKWYEYFEYILPNEPHETHVNLQEASFEWPDHDVIVARYIQPNDYALEVVQAIAESGHRQILISNTSSKALPRFIKMAGLEAYFTEDNAFAVSGHTREVARDKIHVLTEYIKMMPEPPERIILIGDSQKDVELIAGDNVAGYWYRHPGLEPGAPAAPHIKVISDLRTVLQEL